jgi:hypothetical protein
MLLPEHPAQMVHSVTAKKHVTDLGPVRLELPLTATTELAVQTTPVMR